MQVWIRSSHVRQFTRTIWKTCRRYYTTRPRSRKKWLSRDIRWKGSRIENKGDYSHQIIIMKKDWHDSAPIISIAMPQRCNARAQFTSVTLCRYKVKRGMAIKHKKEVNKKDQTFMGVRPKLKNIRELQKSLPPANVHTSEQYARHLEATVPVFSKISRTLSSERMRNFKSLQEKKRIATLQEIAQTVTGRTRDITLESFEAVLCCAIAFVSLYLSHCRLETKRVFPSCVSVCCYRFDLSLSIESKLIDHIVVKSEWFSKKKKGLLEMRLFQRMSRLFHMACEFSLWLALFVLVTWVGYKLYQLTTVLVVVIATI